MIPDPSELLATFVRFSEEITGFPESALKQTGQGPLYVDVCCASTSTAIVAELLHTYQTEGVRNILVSIKFGPVARNIAKLWYVGMWDPLPREWRDKFSAGEGDGPFIVSADAYKNGLLWAAIGANPPGAYAPGYGTWSLPPSVSDK